MKVLSIFLAVLAITAFFYYLFVDPEMLDHLFHGDQPPPAMATDTPPPPPKAPAVEYITPDTTNFVNSPHIVDVPQPKQPSPESDTNAPASSPNP